MDRNLALEVVRVTELAAIAAARLMGRGEKNLSDQAAVDAMRKAFDTLHIQGTVVIGEGERDEAPMLYIGEKVGRWGPEARGKIDLRKSPTENLKAIALALGRDLNDLTVVILDRPRHEELIREVRSVGARIRLIEDGDVAGGVATCFPETGVDVLMGIGGAPEGVITAAAVKSVGGDMQGRLKPRNEEEIVRARKMGIKDLDRVYTAEELAQGEVMFAATGVTSSDFLRGVRFFGGGAETWSVVMRSKTSTVRYVQAQHRFDKKPDYFARQAGGR